jgi:signal peptidase II
MHNISTPNIQRPFQPRFLLTCIGLGLLLCLIDLTIKQLIANHFTEFPEPIQLIDNLFYLRYERNTALAFSIAMPFEFILLLNSVVFAGLLGFLSYKLDLAKKLAAFIYILLMAGALSNLYERYTLAYVTDFLAFGNFPVFNFADSFITISIFLLILFYDRITRPI